MKTAHQLAAELLEGPDLPVYLTVEAGGDSVNSDVGEVRIGELPHSRPNPAFDYEKEDSTEPEDLVTEDCVQLTAWATDTPLSVNWE